MPSRPPMGAMPPHINPLHWNLAPACEPLEKSAGLGWAVTVMMAFRVVPLADALIVASNWSPLYARYPGLVATVNVPVVWPAGTVIVGNDAASSTSELASVTTVPPAGAGALSVTVQVAESPLPPAITDGLQARLVEVCPWLGEVRRSRVVSTMATTTAVAAVSFTAMAS